MMEDGHYGRVWIVSLPPMRVAVYRAVSAAPERDAFAKMKEWVPRQHIADTSEIRAFGFDVDVSVNEQQAGLRGYEVWISVPASVKPSEGVTIQEFEGGVYAAMQIFDPFTEPFAVIPAGWNRLEHWVNTNATYRPAIHQMLEEHLQGEDGATLMLLYPVTDR